MSSCGKYVTNSITDLRARFISGTAFVIGMTVAYVSIQCYVVDVYEPHSPSVLAASMFARDVV